MSELTITEALAELKTIEARLVKKADFIGQYLSRQEKLRDPLEKSGGSAAVIAQELQSMADLQVRKLSLRRAIRQANERVELTVGERTMSLADWLAWKRDVVPGLQRLYQELSRGIQAVRQEAQRRGLVAVGNNEQANRPDDVIINLDERLLAQKAEELTETLGVLDGQLSLKNATTILELDS